MADMTTPTPHGAAELLSAIGPFGSTPSEFAQWLRDNRACLLDVDGARAADVIDALVAKIEHGRGSSAVEPRESGSVVGSIPTSGHPIQQAAVSEGLADLLLSCRGSVKADLIQYQQMLIRGPESRSHFARASIESEVARLRALLDSIDALPSAKQAAGAVPEGIAELSMSMFASREDFEAESLARRFHEAYERLAPSFGYATRTYTREFCPTTENGQLMIAVCRELLAASPAIEPPKQQPDHLAGGECGGVPQWQPIETAPMYVDVLACNPCGFVGRSYKDSKGRWNHIGNPTHWMPLPPAPTSQINPDSAAPLQGKEADHG